MWCPASAVMEGNILRIDGEEVVEFSWTGGVGMICKGPHSSMSQTRHRLSGGKPRDTFIVFLMGGYTPARAIIVCPVLHW